MNQFHSADHLYDTLHALFAQLQADPAAIASFTSSNLVIRMIIEEPDAEVLLDGRQPPLEVFYGPRPGQANLEIRLTSQLLHEIWSGTQEMSQALFSGQIQTTGNVMKATPLLDLFRECQRCYPTIIQQD